MDILRENINRIRTLMKIHEGKTIFPSEDKKVLDDFISFVKNELNIKNHVDIEFRDDKGENQEIKTTAVYRYSDKDPESDIADIKVHAGDRYLIDIMRSVAHELVHHQQNENGKLKGKISNVGGPIEDEANAIAGELIKKYGLNNPDIYNSEDEGNMEFTEQDEGGGESESSGGDTGGDSSSTNANVTTWETGLTRGPANQLTITVWVSNVNRGKGNPIDTSTKWESGASRGKANPIT